MEKGNMTLLMSLPTVVWSFLQLLLCETLRAGFAAAAGRILTWLRVRPQQSIPAWETLSFTNT